MIKLTRIQGEEIYINEDNIQWIECNPDTTITFINGNRFIVKENIEEVLQLIRNNYQLQDAIQGEKNSSLSVNIDTHLIS